MGSARADLNGYGPCEVYGNVYYVSYNQAGNYSTWYWEIRYYGNGGGQWTGADLRWWVGDFAVTSGTFSIPQSKAYDSYILLKSGYFTKPHDADGYLIDDNSNMSFSIDGTAHPGIGSGSAYADPGNAPRIPKKPDTPTAPVMVLGSIEPDSASFTIRAPADNGGSSITTYEMQLLEEISSPTDVLAQWTSGASTQTTVGRKVLTPSTKYRVRYRAINAIGASSWSPTTMFETEAGVYVSDGTNWVGAGPQVSTGSAWENVGPQISDGTAWKDPINV